MENTAAIRTTNSATANKIFNNFVNYFNKCNTKLSINDYKNFNLKTKVLQWSATLTKCATTYAELVVKDNYLYMITTSPRHDPQVALATHRKIIPDNVELEKKALTFSFTTN